MGSSEKKKVNKTERVEFRCTKGFKRSLEDIAEQNDTTLSKVVESICADKIREYFSDVVQIKSHVTDKKLMRGSESQAERDEIIWQKLLEGATPTETANWLNENGYKPARSEEFTLASVNKIRNRLKRERK
ncbi:TPA: hypothetical protein I7716_21245 [Vibrio vulnificus]|nr:hypothetical protein [Vibrio vulnificus]